MLSDISRTLVADTQPVVCDSVTGLAEDFEADRYMGKWYEIYHTQNQPFQSDNWKCVTADYTDLQDDGSFKVYNSSVARFWLPRFGIHGDGKCPADEEDGECYVKFFSPISKWPAEPNYHILDTDYDNYTIVYSCNEDDMAYLWILARTPTISDDLSNELMGKAFDYLPNYETSNLIKDDQDEEKCKY